MRRCHGEERVEEEGANMTAPLPAWIPQRLLTVKEVADLLHLSTRQVRRMITQNDIQAVRLGRSVRIRPEALAATLDMTIEDWK